MMKFVKKGGEHGYRKQTIDDCNYPNKFKFVLFGTYFSRIKYHFGKRFFLN